MKKTELIIIGAGIAGVSAAVYAKRSGLDFLLFEPKAVGGQLLFMESVDNFAGVKPGTSGQTLCQTLIETLDQLEIGLVNEAIEKISINSQEIIIKSSTQEFISQAVIAATGAVFKQLAVPGEDRLLGKGVSYCAICDGFFFRQKDVAVIGGGNTAVEEALYLSNICRKVYLVHRRDSLRAMDYLQKDLKNKTNIEILYNHVVKEIVGDEFVTQTVLLNAQGKEIALNLNGIFVAIGIKPATSFFQNIIKTDDAGFILTDENLKTSCDNIWSAGDCRRRPLRQLVTAAGEGAIASLSAYKYLRGHYVSA